MRREVIAIEDAVGKILCHDVTRIVAGEFKGPLFRKGHLIREEDIPKLKKIGKEHIYILKMDEEDVHEDEAGVRIGRAAAGPGVRISGPVESKVNLVANRPGLLKIRVDMLARVNFLPDVIIATLPTNSTVQAGEIVAGTKVIPLVVKEETISAAEEILQAGSLVEVKPFHSKLFGIIVTGGEVYRGKIKDSFGPMLKDKVINLGSKVGWLNYAPDEAIMIARLIGRQVAIGAEVILVTGGMSVDPDDVTPRGIKMAGVEIISYGAPVLPGAMFLMGYMGEIPVLGVPACAMFNQVTILDLLLPRILAGEMITGEDICTLGHGGLCQNCDSCRFPQCTFGCGGR